METIRKSAPSPLIPKLLTILCFLGGGLAQAQEFSQSFDPTELASRVDETVGPNRRIAQTFAVEAGHLNQVDLFLWQQTPSSGTIPVGTQFAILHTDIEGNPDDSRPALVSGAINGASIPLEITGPVTLDFAPLEIAAGRYAVAIGGGIAGSANWTGASGNQFPDGAGYITEKNQIFLPFPPFTSYGENDFGFRIAWEQLAVAPVIEVHPASLTVDAGSEAMFGVIAVGTPPLSYQWRYNGADIPGATGSVFILNSVQPANAGTYSVWVGNEAGSVISASATLTVNTPPVIELHPVSTTVAAGGNTVFSVTVVGTDPLTYQWRHNGVSIPDATNPTLALHNIQPANAGNYVVVVMNALGTVTSNEATLIVLVNTAPVMESISDQQTYPGETVVFRAVATDAESPDQAFTFSLGAGAPSGSSIDPQTGVFSWTPSVQEQGSLHMITIRVTDNGLPPLSDFKTVTISVLSELRITSANIVDANLTLAWVSIPGNTYRLEYKDRLDDGEWSQVFGELLATSSVSSKTEEAIHSTSSRFYRVVCMPGSPVEVTGGDFQATVGRNSAQIYTVDLNPPIGTAILTLRNQRAVFANGATSLSLTHGATFSLRGLQPGADVLRVEAGGRIRDYPIFVLPNAPPPQPGQGNPLLRPGQSVGQLQLPLLAFDDAGRTKLVDVTVKLRGIQVFAAIGMRTDVARDPSGTPRLVLDLGSIKLDHTHTTGDLTIDVTSGGLPVARFEPPILNVTHEEGVVPELPTRGGTSIPSSGFGETRTRNPPTGLTTTTRVPVPSVTEVQEKDPRDEPPPVIFGEELDGPPAIPPFISTCPAPVLIEAGESTTAEASFIAGDPVYVHNGEFVRGERDYFLDGRGPALSLVRTYRSRVRGQSIIGHNWTINWDKSLVDLSGLGGAGYIYKSGFGRNDRYGSDGGSETPGVFSEVKPDMAGGHNIIQANGGRVAFGPDGQLARIADRTGEGLSFGYNGRWQLVSVRDAVGRQLSLSYDSEGLLVKVQDWVGREVLYHYYKDGEAGGSRHDLKSVTATATTIANYPSGETTVYTYDYESADAGHVHNLVSVTRPQAVFELGIDPNQPFTTVEVTRLRDRAEVLNTYDSTDRVVEQRFKTGTYYFDYAPGGTETIVTDRAIETGQTNGQQTIFRYSGNVPFQIEQTNSLGQAIFTLEHNDPGFVDSTAYVMPSGRRLEFTYDRTNPDAKRRGDLIAMEWVGPSPGQRVRSTQQLNAFGQVLKIVEPRGYAPGANTDHYTTEFVYDPQGNLLRAIFPSFSHFDSRGQVSGNSPRLVREAHYSAFGQVTRIVDTDAVVKDYFYYPSGDIREGLLQAVRITSVDGSKTLETRFELDQIGRPIQVTEANGSVSAARYDEFNRVKATQDPIGASREYEHNKDGRTTEVRLQNLQPDGQGGYQQGTPQWFTLSRSYDPFGSLLTVTRGSSDPNGPTFRTAFTYDEATRVATATSNGGTVRRYEYGPRSLSTRTVAAVGTPDEAAHRIRYDIEGKVISVTDAEGHTAVHDYDWLGRLITLRGPLPGGATSSASTRLEYDASSHITRVYRLDRNGTIIRDIRRTYDEHGRVAVEEDALAGTRAIKTFDDEGRNTRNAVFTVTELALLGETRRSFAQNSFGEVEWAEDGERNRIEYLYDDALRLGTVKRIGSTGHIAVKTSYSYDPKNRVHRFVESSNDGSLQRTNHLTFDSRNLVVGAIDGNGERVGNTYNAIGQLVAIDRFLNPMSSQRETFSYDAEGRLEKLTDGAGHLTVYEFNRRGDRTATTSYDGATPHVIHQTQYDRRGLPIFVTDARGNRVTNVFDELSRLVKRDIQRAAGVTGPTFERFEYDDMNQLLEASNDFSTFTQTFNAQGLVENETQTHGINGSMLSGSIQREFSLNGAVARIRYPGGRTLDFVNDLVGRPTSISEGAQSLANFSYLAPELQAFRDNGNGTRSAFAYDGLARLQAIDHRDPLGSAQASYSYTYDPFGNVLTETENVSGLQDIFNYDPLHRLDSAEISKNLNTGATGGLIDYDYDLAGNRTRVWDRGQETLYSSNGRNQYTAVGPPGQQQPFVWDPDGSLSESPGRKLFYDYARNLVRAEKGQSVYEFTYDALRRLIHKKITEPGQPDRQVHYFYDDDRVIETQGDEAATYVYGQGLDEVVSYRRGGADYFLHQKRLWSVAHVTDAAGQTVESYRYAPFGARQVFDATGNPLPETAIGNLIGFTGRWLEKELGLYYYRARWYDHELGRFISPDPKGFIDGLNVYEYARNNPATFFDPMGTTAEEFLGGLKDGFLDRFLGGWWDTLQTIADVVLNVGDYVETLKTMLKALTDPDIRANVWGAIKEAVETELADAWSLVEGAINALSGPVDKQAGQALGSALGFLASKLMRGGGSIAAFFAKIGQKVKDILQRIRCVGLGTGCFLAGTLVIADEGVKKIEDVKVGDKVLSRNEQTGEQGYKTVLRTFPGYNVAVCRVRIVELLPTQQKGRTEHHRVGLEKSSEEGGEDSDEPPLAIQEILCTPDHPFLADGRGFVRADFLKPGDRLVDEADGRLEVVGVEVWQETVRTYNFEVAEWHTYFVKGGELGTGVWVHNNNKCPPGVKEVTLSRTNHPESVQHLEDTGMVGVELPVVREGTAKRRREAVKHLETKPGFDRDESPPAFLRNDGDPVSVRYIPSSDNKGAGASLGNQARGFDRVIIRVVE